MDLADTSDDTFAMEAFLARQECTWLLPFPGMDKSGEEICRLFMAQACPRGRACPLRHTLGDKAVVCKHWLRSLCKKGDECEFLHQFDPLRMPECYFYTTYGECTNDECLFLHVDPESKKKDCAWYARGFCKHGSECRNRHRKLTLCPQYLYGFCPLGPECKLAHPRFEIPTSNTIDPDTNRPAAGGVAAGDGGMMQRRKLICHNCGKPGHKAAECQVGKSQPLQPTLNPGMGGSAPLPVGGGLPTRDSSSHMGGGGLHVQGSSGGGLVCHRCGQPGHKRPQCPLNTTGQQQNMSEVTCFKCNQKGHLANQCPRGVGGGGGGFNSQPSYGQPFNPQTFGQPPFNPQPYGQQPYNPQQGQAHRQQRFQ